jgi:hypothetical protein
MPTELGVAQLRNKDKPEAFIAQVSKTKGTSTKLNYPIGKFDLGINGVPPRTIELINASCFQARIIPRVMNWADGLSNFAMIPAYPEYTDLIFKYGVSLPSQCVDVMFTPENWPSDTFGNEYGASFLANILDVFRGGIGDLSQMMGSTDMVRNLKTIAAAIKGTNEKPGNKRGIVREFGGDIIEKGAGLLQSINDKANSNSGDLGTVGAGILSAAASMLSGARVDFPSVWKDSSFTPTCSITVKLYNPMPGDVESTKYYITRPLAALMCLALPQSQIVGNKENNISAYNWPFFCSVECPGVFTMPFAAIGGISVQKSGDQQLASFNQLITQINVTIDFISLYPTMIVGAEPDNRLHLKQYLTNLETPQEVGITLVDTETISPAASNSSRNTDTISTTPRSSLKSQETYTAIKFGEFGR